ncbi:cation:proton antiporter [Catenuloplanes atrovinosus]|uniref:Kef-type K+ transport system membrane component KefB n=1 Tax=Catenuloplanes atrovinosus TaxID=137266 RepID=A0AAE3YPP5_9ACTN|nr:cation:proton antiporter [Catenuloplanes atrovinosus]MDR7276952.1 Kef-type K+ transport system membrane component KefB [Catenuloplanes atrovinosus]
MTFTAPPPSLGGHQLLVFLVAVVTLLLVARLLASLAERVGMPAIVGELATGVILGPSLLGHLLPGLTGWIFPSAAQQMNLLDAVGQLGILLLVGLTGTHLDVAMVRRRKATAARISLGGLLIPLVLGLGVGYLLADWISGAPVADRTLFAGFIAVAMCVTAIPVIAKTLSDMRLLHRDIGQLTMAAGTIDDAVGWFLLSVVSMAATVGLAAGHVFQAIGYLLGFVALAVLAGRPLVRRAMRLADRAEGPGPSIVTAVVIVLTGAAMTQALHMEPVFGAFVAGILVGLPRAANQAKLAALRTVVLTVLAPLFLATAGFRMDLTALAEPRVALAAVVVLAVAILGKFAGAYAGARLSRLSRWEGLAIGAGMNSRGVVEVVVALTGLRLGILNTAGYTIVVLVAIVTSVMAPPLLRYTCARITENEDERLRKIDHDTWAGVPARPSPSSAGEPA